MLALHRVKSICPAVGRTMAVASERKEFVDPEWESAKPYESVPKQSVLSRDFFPGGELYNAPLEKFVKVLRKKHGNLVRLPGVLRRPELVMTFEPEDFKKIYRTEGSWPTRRNLETITYYRTEKRQDLFGKFRGLVDEQGQQWQKYRTIINPVMMQPKTVSLYVEDIDAVAKDFINITRKYRDSNNEAPAEYGTFIQRFTLEAVGVIALETRLNVLEPKVGNKGTELAQIADRVFSLSYHLDILPSIWKYVATPQFNEMMKLLDRMLEITMDYVEEAIERIDRQKSQKPEELQSVLEKLLKIDKDVAVVMALDMLAVGIDTTSSTLKSLLYLLAKHPDKQARLREEILQILPNKNDRLTPEKMKNLPYLRACMKEQHRVLPVTSGNVRTTGSDIVLQGYRIPKGTDVVMNHAFTAQQEHHFPEPQKFIPERWLKDESHAEAVGCPHSKNAHPFTYMPFGFGNRACIGKRFAELETAILTARMVREFDLSWHHADPTIQSHVLQSIVGDYKIRLVDRK